MKKRNKPLTKDEFKILAATTDDDLVRVFPDHTRSYLRKVKGELSPISEQIAVDKKMAQKQATITTTEKKYKELLKENEEIIHELNALKSVGRDIETFKILPSANIKSEATAFIIASDWHYEEEVKSGSINGLNSFNLNIANQRVERFFQNALKLIKKEQQDVVIKDVVLALLGDFISGNIHDELLETAQLQPIDACKEVQRQIASGIDFLLKNTDCNLVVPCCAGNHSRITKKSRHATETGNSLETFIYSNLAWHYQDEKRVKFILQEGYHIYLNVYGYTLRFHHGHDLKYQGGVGGIYIPVNKALSQWNKAKHADIDIFGHWHQSKIDGHFVCNGSLVGYNAYALSIKADFEPPQQSFFLLDRDRGRTVVAPILLNRS